MTKCVVCGGTMEFSFRAKVLSKYDAAYHRCGECGFLRADRPHWLEEACGDAIVDADTGLAQRNLSIAARLAPLLYFCLVRHGTYVDVAGGYGLLVRLMRDLGFNFFWDDKYCQNLFARGFESTYADAPVTAVTAFEVMEHLPDPVAFIAATMEKFGTRTLIFTTELYPEAGVPPVDWWYYAFNTGQHISFFQKKTLARIAAALGVRVVSMHGLHVFTDQPIKNELLARLLTSPVAAPVALYVRRRLGSKTFSDHRLRLGSQDP